ncbi:MAG: hypothetical protein RIE58_01285 [Vicingaceae bacterium]
MAQLHHVIGSILRDIAQGRVTADVYSREVSKYYEQDSLLRLFPVPRTEIKEVEIDLKFAISAINIDAERSEDRDAKLSGIFEKYSELISDAFFDKLMNANKRSTMNWPIWQSLVLDFDNPENRVALITELVDFFEENRNNLLIEELGQAEGESDSNVVNLNLKKEETYDGIFDVFDEVIFDQIDLAANAKAKDLLSNAKSNIRSEVYFKVLESMNGEVEYLESSEYMAEVLVSNQELQELPESSISSIKIVTTLKNYVWSQVEEKDGKTIRRLIPE